ncbi:hypothetical protein [Novosphingobium decolorationis]|uniref:Uncharacterized protein n=1 Tax=Novosphingobium decolorationis TaxID=2698673 RepID=A0ABX8E3V5_9SPHN|nr:hypothetical protein [Novosphingobium decolorationis]QVM82940.1 hypothetical protein HT578_03765 [Novosphingobium decolorationis]
MANEGGEGAGAEGGEGAGGFGSSADLLGGAGAGAAAAAGQGEGGGAEAGAGLGEGGGADPEWWGGLSDQAEGESAANRDYVKSKGWRTPDDAIKSYREAERALRDGGRIKVPGEGATAEEVASYRTAIGVPETVEGYTLPQLQDADGNAVPLDDTLLGKMLPRALEHGVPAEAMNGLINDFVQAQLDDQAAFDKGTTDAAAAWVAKQGADGHAKLAAIDSAARALGLSSQELIAMRNAMAQVSGAETGVAKMLDTFTRLGQGMAEDTLITGGQGRFGVTGREAQGELDKMKAKAKSDPAFGNAVRTEGTPENARWNRLQDQAAKWQERQEQAA